MDADHELRDGPRMDLHSLRARDAALDALSGDIQRSAAEWAASDFRGSADMASLRHLLCDRPVLITGSAGYLGFALYLTLRKLGVGVVGIDVVPGAATDQVADVSDVEATKRCGQACGAVLHCAALHAPHASAWHARDFTTTNVAGTENVLALALPTVHTSTTSLTITQRVKAREQAGELVWLDEQAQRPDRATAEEKYTPSLDAPRNKYGKTKLAAEQSCLAAARAGADVVVLRAPRFFPEDVLEENSLPLPNIKANELLGRRCSLVDLIDAHLRALARVRRLRGAVLTLAPPWPLECVPSGVSFSAADAGAQLRARHPHAERLYAWHGWRLPKAITRVYDCTAAVEALDWQPHLTFEAVLRLMEDASRPDDRVDADAMLEENGLASAAGECERPRTQPNRADGRKLLEQVLRGAY